MTDTERELEDDEEDILVYVKFEGFSQNNVFGNEKLQLDMIGLDMDNPLMQVNGKLYEGTYEDAIGTYMFFEEEKSRDELDPVFDTAPTLKYFGKTRKLLKMNRVFMAPRPEVFGASENSKFIPNMDTIKEAGIPPKYQEEALSSWEKLREERTSALNAYLEKQRIRAEKKSRGIEMESDSDDDNPFMFKCGNEEISTLAKTNPAGKESKDSEEKKEEVPDKIFNNS